jgi:hypothetical protein
MLDPALDSTVAASVSVFFFLEPSEAILMDFEILWAKS